jgi:hypothetical protein
VGRTPRHIVLIHHLGVIWELWLNGGQRARWENIYQPVHLLFVEETRRSHLTAPSQALGLKQNDRRVLVVCLFVELMLPEIQEESGAHQ